MSQPNLTASYSSPSNPTFSISLPLPLSSTPSNLDDKSAYLSALRAAVASTQDTINKELTQRMEADKAAEAASGAKSGMDEDKEEENYGEEVQEEEA